MEMPKLKIGVFLLIVLLSTISWARGDKDVRKFFPFRGRSIMEQVYFMQQEGNWLSISDNLIFRAANNHHK